MKRKSLRTNLRCGRRMFLPTRLFRKKKNLKINLKIYLSEQPSDLLACKGTLACTATLVEICELPPQKKKFLKEFDDIFPKKTSLNFHLLGV